MKNNLPEIIMHYNVYDDRYYIYRGEDYLYDTQDEESAVEMFGQFCFDLSMEINN